MDWFRLFAELQKAGINNAELARRLNVARWKVHDWKMGGEPPYSYGAQIVEIYTANVAHQRPNTTTGTV